MKSTASKTPIWVKFAWYYLLAVIFLAWGFAIGHFHVFPYFIWEGAAAFVAGDVEEETSLMEKIENEVTGNPVRYLYPRMRSLALEKYQPVDDRFGFFKDARNIPTFYSRTSRGAYLIHGVFGFADGKYGSLLVSADGKILRHWVFKPPAGNNQLNPGKNGFAADGQVISNAFGVLQAQDYCGEMLWTVNEGLFHHSVEPVDESSVWVINEFDYEQRDIRTGALEQAFSIFDLIEANPDLHIFEPRLNVTGWQISGVASLPDDYPEHQIALSDPFHMNDVDPLSAELEDYYDLFRKGDLLISSRTLNLLFVVRPETLEVLWYSFGKSSRQHDPDFNPFGTLTLFDNNSHGEYSRIIEMEVISQKTRTLVNGRKVKLKNDRHGNHEFLDDRSTILVDYRGRVIHLDKNGEIQFEFLNNFRKGKLLELRNVHYLDDEMLFRLEDSCGLTVQLGDR